MVGASQPAVMIIVALAFGPGVQAGGESTTGSASAGLPSLEETLGNLVGRLVAGQARPGVIVSVTGSKVYTDLGAADGVKVGDEFEVVRKVTVIKHPVSGEKIGEERDVAGRLRVTSVQEKMSVCEVTVGQAEQKNATGEFNKLLRPRGGKKHTVIIGSVSVDAGAAITKEAFSAALAAAARNSTSLDLVEEALAEYELRATLTGAEGGCKIALVLIERRSGQVFRQTEGLHQTSLTAADLGLRTAVVVDLKATLNLDPIFEAAKSVTVVARSGDALVFPSVGSARHTAVVYASGRVVVAQGTSLAKLRELDELEATLTFLYGLFRKVQATLAADLATLAWRQRSRVYTDRGKVFREIWFPRHARGVYDYVLTVPKCEVREARLVAFGSHSGYDANLELVLDGASLFKTRDESYKTRVDITRLYRYGEHTFEVRSGGWRGVSGYTILQVVTEDTDTWPTFRDKANNIQGTVGPVCGSVKELFLPQGLAETRSGQPAARPRPRPSPRATDSEKQLKSWLALARGYYRMDRIDRAEEYCQKVLDAGPSDAELAAEAKKLMAQIQARKKELNP